MDRTPLALQSIGKQLGPRIAAVRPQAVFAAGSIPVAAIGGDEPAFFWTDATFPGMRDYYSEFGQLSSASVEDALRQERQAFARAQLVFLASEWAGQQVSHYYPEAAHKVRVVPFGANLDPGLELSEARSLVDSRSSNPCNLLFVGVDWIRKGGAIAVEVVRLLNELGVPAQLTVAGCVPYGRDIPPFVSLQGFVSLSSQEGRDKLRNLFRQAHFLLVPSRAEAFGIVFCEAGAFALPAIGTRTGGIPSIINDQTTGMMLDLRAPPREYAEAIGRLWQNRERYSEMAVDAFLEYRRHFTWKTATGRVGALIRQSLNSCA